MSETWMQITALIISVIGIFLANVGLIFWFRSESINDWRRSDAEMKEFRQAMFDEKKDFHERLRAIKERRLEQEKK